MPSLLSYWHHYFSPHSLLCIHWNLTPSCSGLHILDHTQCHLQSLFVHGHLFCSQGLINSGLQLINEIGDNTIPVFVLFVSCFFVISKKVITVTFLAFLKHGISNWNYCRLVWIHVHKFILSTPSACEFQIHYSPPLSIQTNINLTKRRMSLELFGLMHLLMQTRFEWIW